MAAGQELMQSLKSIRTFFGDLSRLLRTADAMFLDEGWAEIGATSTCLIGSSYSVDAGEKWIPRIAQRRYRNGESFPSVVAMVSLLLDNHKDHKIDEPFITSGYFLFPDDAEEPELETWNAIAFWPQANRRAGEAFVMGPERQTKPKHRWLRAQGFFHPLVGITSPDAIKNLVVSPLLEMIQKSAAAEPALRS